ncbi:MAG: response regulator [Candidatus Scalinduaceae bacterium]
MSILIVDDDVDVREFLEIFIKEEGYRVDIANDGKIALSLLNQNKYKVVFLDLKMPDLNGVETLRHIKERYPDVVVVIITGEKHCKREKKAREIGVFEVVHKPFTLDRMREVLKRVYEKRK